MSLFQGLSKVGSRLVASFKGGESIPLVRQARFLQKTLGSDVTSDGEITDLSFTLIPGRTYLILPNFHAVMTGTGPDVEVDVAIKDGSTTLSTLKLRSDATTFFGYPTCRPFIYRVVDGAITFEASSATANSKIQASGDTFVQVVELESQETAFFD